MNRLMLVDDEKYILNALYRTLYNEGYEIELYDDPREALQCARTTPFDLVISDYRMPEMDGVSFLVSFKKFQSDAVRMMLSGYADLDALQGAVNEAEIFRFIAKPWQDYDLKIVIAHALAHQAVLSENKRLADQVREQQETLDMLEKKYPGITHVKRAPDDSIILDESDV
ncbi:MAG: response regulator [Pseudomonadota bacterium]